MSHLSHRPEIDGLRAVAVVPVVLFHAGFPAFGGGFIGVDVFFVISGYLIAGIIFREKAAGTFSPGQFFERRARRILPALAAVIIGSSIGAWLWLMPAQFDHFTKSVVAVSLFSSNFFFRKNVDYFGPTAEEMPLLHTWSLAVEEQFYFVFPLIVMALWPLGRRALSVALIAAFLMSFGLSEYASRHHPTANFYLIPSRVWELLVGVLAAFVVMPTMSTLVRQSFAAIGLTLVIAALIAFDRTTPTPSALTLIPVIGTALILLFADQRTVVGKLLSRRPMVAIGLISYSLYLWHVPIFAFARAYSFDRPSTSTFLVLSALSVALATVTWRYVEQPIRRRTLLLSRRPLFVSAGCVTAAFIVTALVAGPTFSNSRMRLGDAAYERAQLFDLLRAERWAAILNGTCNQGEQDSGPLQPFLHKWDCLGEGPFRGVIVVGDSTAADKASGLRQNGIDIGQFTVASCEMVPSLMNEGCATAFAKIPELKASGDLRGLILVKRMLNEHGELDPVKMEELISYWSGFGVPLLIISTTPEFPQFDQRATRYALLDETISLSGFENFDIANRSIEAIERTAAGRALVVDGGATYCSIMGEQCRPILKNEFQIVDAIHLSKESAKRFMKVVISTATWRSFTEKLTAKH